MKKILTKIVTLLVITSVSFLISCGKKGPLYLIDKDGNRIEQKKIEK